MGRSFNLVTLFINIPREKREREKRQRGRRERQRGRKEREREEGERVWEKQSVRGERYNLSFSTS